MNFYVDVYDDIGGRNKCREGTSSRRSLQEVQMALSLYNRFITSFLLFVIFLAISGCVSNQTEQSSCEKSDERSKMGLTEGASRNNLIKRYLEDAQCAIAVRNYGIALDCYRKADNLGSALAKYKLGLAYFEGVMIGKDVDKGLKYIRAAAVMECTEAAEFLKERLARVAKLLDANAKITEWYGISIGQVVGKQDVILWDVEADVYEKNATEGRWITILPPKHPQAPDTKIHIHLDVKTHCINGIRAYVPVKVNGKGRDVFASVSSALLEPFEKIAGCAGEYYESTDNVVTKGLKLIDSANENGLKVSYTTRYFGSHLELEAYGTCFAEFCNNTTRR